MNNTLSRFNINLSWIRNKMIRINMVLHKKKEDIRIIDIKKELLRHIIDSSLYPTSLIDTNYFNNEILNKMLGDDIDYTHTDRININIFSPSTSYPSTYEISKLPKDIIIFADIQN